MADSKISALTSYTTPLSADVLPIVDTANTTTKKISWSALLTALAAATQTFTNKIFSDSTSYFGNVSDTTKKLIFSLGGATTAKTMTIVSSHTNDRTITLPDATDTLVGKATTDTLTNKTLTSPTLTTPTLGAATATSIAAATNASVNMLSGTYNTIQTYTPTAAGTATLDLSKGNIHHITMPAGNITIALSNGTAGQCFVIRILQDSTGSRTVTWFTTIRWAGGSPPTLTTSANKADTLGFEITGSSTYDAAVVFANV